LPTPAEVAQIGRSLGLPLIMHNTAAPVLCHPIKHGARRHLPQGR
jgi:O-acetylhomoserine (thiol)-lyase